MYIQTAHGQKIQQFHTFKYWCLDKTKNYLTQRGKVKPPIPNKNQKNYTQRNIVHKYRNKNHTCHFLVRGTEITARVRRGTRGKRMGFKPQKVKYVQVEHAVYF